MLYQGKGNFKMIEKLYTIFTYCSTHFLTQGWSKDISSGGHGETLASGSRGNRAKFIYIELCLFALTCFRVT